jgi:hypothetical protein
MKQDTNVVSKVLVYDPDPSALDTLKDFCNQNGLVGLRAFGDIMSDVVRSNIELGAICLSEEKDENGRSGVELAVELHKQRSEIPIFLRRKDTCQLDDLTDKQKKVFAGAYQIADMSRLKDLIDSYLFNQHFPGELVRGISDLTQNTLQNSFPSMEVQSSTPYVVKDKIIYGEVFSLLNLEASWCRGYMMFQGDESEFLELARARKTSITQAEPDFRSINSLLSEISNVAWGRFKSQFISSQLGDEHKHKIQVPIIVNHARKYITFGSDDPMLCFKYIIRDPNGDVGPMTLLQKFIFSLSWMPEKFSENKQKLDGFLNSGELELF